MLTELLKRLEEKEARMIDLRRYFHENPELSFEEENTAKTIAAFYEGKDVTVQTNVGEGYGITVDIVGAKLGPTIAIRADFDALPIEEATGLPYASKNPGVMHACGHDGHTAYMMILAETLAEMKESLAGTVRIIHQPAEETPPGGAIGMIRGGCLDGVDHVFGIHLMSQGPLGQVHTHIGPTQSGRATFEVKFQGKGGHGSSPHTANDSIVAASHFVTAVQTIVSRRMNPFHMATVTIGSFDGKGSANVIKDSVVLKGDVRMMEEESRAILKESFEQIVKGTAETFGMTYELSYEDDYPVLMNDEEMTNLVREAIEDVNLPEVTAILDPGPITASEDFAYYALERPSSFFFVGAEPDGQLGYPHHHPKFDINEKSLLIAAKAMATVVVRHQNA